MMLKDNVLARDPYITAREENSSQYTKEYEGPMMDTNSTLGRIIDVSFEKSEKINQRNIDSEGYGSSDVGVTIASKYLGTLSKHIAQKITDANPQRADYELLRTLADLDPERIALCGIYGCLYAAGSGFTSAPMWIHTGHLVASELFAAGLIKHDPRLAKIVEKEARRSYKQVLRRQRLAQHRATKYGYKNDHWDQDGIIYAGNWVLDVTVECLKGVFSYYEAPDKTLGIQVTPEAMEEASLVIAETIERHPTFVPFQEPPKPWTGFTMEPVDGRAPWVTPFLRAHHKETTAAARHAIADGTMKPALDAVTALQSVAFVINEPVLAIIREVVKRKLEIKGLPGKTVKLPKLPSNIKELPPATQFALREEREEARVFNMGVMNQRVQLEADLKTAEYLKGSPYWTPMNCDWRGRVNPLCQFNFTRGDAVRSLFLFRDGLPIGEEGIEALKVHVANVGAFDKVDKRSIEERLKWTNEHLPLIHLIRLHPLSEQSVAIWAKADKPFLFLAACFELSEAVTEGPSFVTHLPISFDGTCSGLQHLSCMTRDEKTAGLVNLLPAAEPNDIYSAIGETVAQRIAADVGKLHTKKDPKTKEEVVDEDKPKIAKLFADYGVGRKEVKRNTMTYSYSSPKYGMAQQQQVDLMDTLKDEVTSGKRKEHPFAPYEKGSKDTEGNVRAGKAARYIANHVYDAIEECVSLPAQAMKFLQGIAGALAHEGKPVYWTTPAGIPWVNKYNPPILKRLTLYLHDRGPIRSNIAVGNEAEIDKNRAKNGIAANATHACDAAHLLLTVNACVQAGITAIATVHDSFGCLAPQAAQFNKIIRSTLIRMYEDHDVLSEILERAKCDLTQHSWNRLPSVPQKGNLNLREIENAVYAFA